MSSVRNIKQPRQRLTYRQKNKEWRKENVDYGNTQSFYTNGEVRRNIDNKLINLNLYNGIVNIKDMIRIINPADENASYVPDNVPHHPIIVPKIDLLVGEEINRPFDYSFVVTDSESITRKMNDKKEEYRSNLASFLEANYSDEELQEKMAELEKYMKYTWKDQREKMANQITKYYFEQGKFKEKFSKGFKDALLFGEEMYLLDIVNGEPTIEVLNPINVRAIQAGASDRIEDSSVIVIENFRSPNYLIDKYYEELKPDEIDELLTYDTSKGNAKASNYVDDQNNHLLMFPERDIMDGWLDVAELNGHMFRSNFCDEFGNIRELIVRWKSLRKVLKVKYYDEYGKVQYKFESEEYLINPNLGEESKTIWVSEGWEGVRLGKNTYVRMKPLGVQYAPVDQPIKNHLGVIGQLYNTNHARPVSLVDRAKNYQYLYDVIWDRLNKAIAANHGKIMEVDIAKIPDGWDMEKWLHFAFVNKIAVLDSFKEGNKGTSTGRLAGGMNTVGGRAIDMETGNYIQQHIQLLEFIKMEMSDILGISKQREGQINNRETVGGVERSVNQSSHITEYWFAKHEALKLRVLESFLEMAKHALKTEGNKQLQYVLDDQTVETLFLGDEGFTEASYGVVVTNSSKYAQLEQMVQQNAQAMLQNGGSFKTLLDITFSNSLMDMRRKIENAEDEQAAQAQQQQQAEAEREQMALQAAQQEKQQELEFNYFKANLDDSTKRYVAELQANTVAQGDESMITEEDGINNPLEVAKFDLDVAKFKSERLLAIKQMSDDMVKHKDEMKIKEKDIAVKRIQKKKSST